MPPAGTLRALIRLQKKSLEPAGQFDTTPGWTTFAKAWARIETIDAIEKFNGVQTSGAPTHRFRIRKWPSLSVTAEHWIEWGARRFAIRGVEDLRELGRELELLAEEREDVA